MTISSVPAISTATPSLAPAPAVRPVAPVAPVSAPLEPAVRVDIRSPDRSTPETPVPVADRPRAAPEERRITVDQETKSLVYQVIDPSSGDVVVQLPEPTVLKTRAYAEAAAARTKGSERPLDRSA